METNDYRLDKLEEHMRVVYNDVKAIMTNHLPHIQEDIAAIKIQLKVWTWMMGLIISGVIALVIKAFA